MWNNYNGFEGFEFLKLKINTIWSSIKFKSQKAVTQWKPFYEFLSLNLILEKLVKNSWYLQVDQLGIQHYNSPYNSTLLFVVFYLFCNQTDRWEV
jgi:hypothetical protein